MRRMPDNVEIQGLEFQIKSDSGSVANELNILKTALERLKTATSGGIKGLTSVSNQLSALSKALGGINNSSIQKLKSLSDGLTTLKNVGTVKISSSIANQLNNLSDALSQVKWTDGDKISALAEGLQPLTQLGRANLTTFINQLGKLPTVIEQLDQADLDKFTRQMKELATAIAPLADEMQKVSAGFSAFPSKVQKVASSTSAYNSAMSGASKSTSGLNTLLGGVKFSAFLYGLKTVKGAIGTAITKSNEYQENLNLFTVAMGEYADEAFEYGQTVSDTLGIDLSEWIRNQGVFNTLLTGFGDTAERSALMSKNLTQLGYDLSSFFNLPVEEAMQKLQSGISGELEPLRHLGYDLSQARLEAVALSLGIDKSVASMNQAEKAELRYYAIMTRVTTAQGDLARTLESPANQLRILKSELNQLTRAIGNIFIPMLTKILPYAIAVVEVITDVAQKVATLFGFEMTEVDYSGMGNLASGAENVSESMESATDSAKKLKQYTAGFDELNIFSADNSGITNAGDALGGSGFGFELPTYNFIDESVKNRTQEIKSTLEQSLAEITVIVSGFALAVGAILVLTGVQIPLGLGLMAAGAIGIATTAAINWDSMSSELTSTLSLITGMVSGFFLALGTILLLTGGSIPLGLGLIAIGVAGYVTAVSVNWHSSDQHVTDALTTIIGIVSGAFLAIGAFLALTGVNMPLGIALIAVGAVSLAATMALNWNSLEDPVSNTVSKIALIVETGMLALGAILAFTGINTPLGIALLALGAVTLAATVALNWNGMSDKVRNVISIITTVVGAALLAVGAILAFTAVNIPLGIALMAGGALALATAVSVNWDSIKDKIKTVISGIVAILSGALVVLGILLCLSGGGIGLGLAVLAAGLAGSYAAWKLDDNPVTRFVKKMANGIIDILNWCVDKINEFFHFQFDGLVIAGVEIIPSFDVQLVNIPRIPNFAQGGFVDEGQLFVAREAGAEMVGSIGRRTAVANNDQIVEGISAGVSVANDGVIAAIYALMNVVEEKDMNVSITEDAIGRSYDRYNNRRGIRVNKGAFSNAY